MSIPGLSLDGWLLIKQPVRPTIGLAGKMPWLKENPGANGAREYI
jgi:hypothetical protein